jgi:hypothetical protein
MTVNTEMLKSFGTSVDKSKTMPFFGLEVELGQSGVTIAGRGMWNGRAVEIVLAIDEIVVRLTSADRS